MKRREKREQHRYDYEKETYVYETGIDKHKKICYYFT